MTKQTRPTKGGPDQTFESGVSTASVGALVLSFYSFVPTDIKLIACKSHAKVNFSTILNFALLALGFLITSSLVASMGFLFTSFMDFVW